MVHQQSRFCFLLLLRVGVLLLGAGGCQRRSYFAFPVVAAIAPGARPTPTTPANSAQAPAGGRPASPSAAGRPKRAYAHQAIAAGVARPTRRPAASGGVLLPEAKRRRPNQALCAFSQRSQVGRLRKSANSQYGEEPREWLGNAIIGLLFAGLVLGIVLGPVWLKIAAGALVACIFLLGYLYAKGLAKWR